jgi:hypothetical protein
MRGGAIAEAYALAALLAGCATSHGLAAPFDSGAQNGAVDASGEAPDPVSSAPLDAATDGAVLDAPFDGAGATETAIDADGEAAAQGDGSFGAAADAEADAAAPTCGTAPCAASQLCIVMQSNGGPAHCAPLNDAGGCTAPLAYSSVCANLANKPGCASSGSLQPIKCIDTPSGCANAPSCTCLPSDVCAVAFGSCSSVQQGRVFCVNASP